MRIAVAAIFTCFPSLVAASLVVLPKFYLESSSCRRREFLVKTLLSGIAFAFPAAAAAADAPDDDVANFQPLLSIESASQANALGEMRIYPDPSLRQIASPVRTFGPDVEHVADILVAGMKSNATTAIQYGIDARMIVLKGSASPNHDSSPPLVLINPNILSRSSEFSMVQWREYCLVVVDLDVVANNSKPALQLEVDLLRDEVVEVAAQDVTGRPVRKALSGEPARAFLHELDHINGILIIDHASLDELPAAVAQLEAPHHVTRQKRAFERDTYQGNTPLYW